MARARAHVSSALADMLYSDWVRVIEQANLGKQDTLIAQRYLLEAIPQIEIAAELDIDRSTISRRLPHILDKLERTAAKLGIM